MSHASRLLFLISACERIVSACRQGATATDRIDWASVQRQFEEVLKEVREELAQMTPADPQRRESSSFRAVTVANIFEEAKAK